MKKLNKKHGFTLAELLIVVAIIAVLVAISIPIFTTQLEKSREAVDAANLRAAYAEVMAAGITGDSTNYTKKVDLKQQKSSWQNAFDFPSTMVGAGASKAPQKAQKSVTVTFSPSTGKANVSIKLTK